MPVSGYATQITTPSLGGQDDRLHSLSDTQQRSDPEAQAEAVVSRRDVAPAGGTT